MTSTEMIPRTDIEARAIAAYEANEERLRREEDASKALDLVLRIKEFRKFLAELDIPLEPDEEGIVTIGDYLFGFRPESNSEYHYSVSAMFTTGTCEKCCGTGISPYISSLEELGRFLLRPTFRCAVYTGCSRSERSPSRGSQTTEERLLAVLREYISDVCAEDRP